MHHGSDPVNKNGKKSCNHQYQNSCWS